MKNSFTSMVDITLLPTPEQAVQEYESAGGSLTLSNKFGTDPLQNNTLLKHQRESEVSSHLNFDDIFKNVVNGNQQPFVMGLLYFINVTDRLAQQI